MVERDTRSDPTAGDDQVRDMVREFLSGSRRWSESMVASLRDQARSYSARLPSIDSPLRAKNQSVRSQAGATKALAESLETSREVVDIAMSAHRRSIEGIETSIGGVLDMLSGQLRAIQSHLTLGQGLLTDPPSAQNALACDQGAGVDPGVSGAVPSCSTIES